MELKQIKELMNKFDNSGIHKLEVEINGTTIKLEKETKNIVEALVPQQNYVIEQPQLGTSINKTENKEKVHEIEGTKITAPLVGNYYSKPSPDSQPFVKVGDTVSKGDTLFIIEAMKVMNEVKAPTGGKIISIDGEDGKIVEFDQTIMIIK